MGADHVKAHISQRLTPYLEGIDRRVVLRHKKFVTSRHLAQWLLRVNAAEARLSNSSEMFFAARKFTGEAFRKFSNLLII